MRFESWKEAVAFLAFAGVVFGLIAIWTDRTLDFWLSRASGHPVNCPFWLSFLVTVVLNAVIFAVNVLSEIARLVV